MKKEIKLKKRTIQTNSYQNSIKTGVIGASLMIAFTLLIELINPGQNIGSKFLKYFIFAIPLAMGLSTMKENIDNKHRFFQKGTTYAIVASFTAALLMVTANIPTMPFSDFGLATLSTEMADARTVTSATMAPMLVSVMFFLEIFVMGMLTSFGLLLFMYDVARTA